MADCPTWQFTTWQSKNKGCSLDQELSESLHPMQRFLISFPLRFAEVSARHQQKSRTSQHFGKSLDQELLKLNFLSIEKKKSSQSEECLLCFKPFFSDPLIRL